jgi:hypothetical protein
MRYGGIDYGVSRDPSEPTKFRFTIYTEPVPGSPPERVSGALYHSYDDAAAACKKLIALRDAAPPHAPHCATQFRPEAQRSGLPHGNKQNLQELWTRDNWLRELLQRVDQQGPLR